MYFYLPIYKETTEQFEEKYEAKYAKRIKELESQSAGEISHNFQIKIKDQIAKDIGRSWRQNHAVGWIRVGKGKGGFTFIIARSSTKRPRKPERHFNLIPPDECYAGYHVISFTECNTTDEVLSKFSKIFSEIVQDEPFNGCFVDDSQITNLSSFINWKALIDE